jgi:hydrogenase maturation protease
MNRPSILIAGVGNIFLGDDAFGVEVVQRLAERTLPDEVRVVDFGIRGLDLTYALLDDHDAVILVDATPRGGTPGTLYVIEPEPEHAEPTEQADLTVVAHGMDPAKVLRLVAALGGRVGRLLLVGCEPGPIGADEEIGLGLSEPVRAAAEEAVGLIESLVADLLQHLETNAPREQEMRK